MNKGIAVTGMGIVSSIGKNVEENFNSLVAQKHGISHIDILQTSHKGRLPVGEIKMTNKALASFLELEEHRVFTRSSLLGSIAAKEAITSAGISDISNCKTGFISGTTVGGMDMVEKHYLDFFQSTKNHKYIETQHCGFSTQEIAGYLGIRDFVTTISTACSSAANAIILGARMIKNGKLDRVVVGGSDCLSKFTVNGFNSLMILSEEHCRPFDRDRNGLNLGEGAAYLVLEADHLVQKEHKRVLARLCGYGNANDAFHQTASSSWGIGAFLAMEKAVKSAEIKPSEIDYINVHGTATSNNDLSEGRAMCKLFENTPVPRFGSTKAFTGHTLAAAASVEAVFSILSLQKDLVFPHLNFKNKMEEFDLVPQTELLSQEMHTILSNSFGFGGNCSSLIFSKTDR